MAYSANVDGYQSYWFQVLLFNLMDIEIVPISQNIGTIAAP